MGLGVFLWARYSCTRGRGVISIRVPFAVSAKVPCMAVERDRCGNIRRGTRSFIRVYIREAPFGTRTERCITWTDQCPGNGTGQAMTAKPLQ
jgi:hypothetical protein